MLSKLTPIRIVGVLTVAGLAAAIFYYADLTRTPFTAPAATRDDPESPGSRTLASQVEGFVSNRRALDKTVWRDEVAAQAYEQLVIALWDDLRSTEDYTRVLKKLEFETLTIATPAAATTTLDDITVSRLDGPKKALTPERWEDWLLRQKSDGYELVQSEWHHAAFDTSDPDQPKSRLNVEFHVENTRMDQRLIIRGELKIAWSDQRTDNGHHVPKTIDATGMSILSRIGRPHFERVAIEALQNQRLSDLILYDLDRNGRSDLIFPDANVIVYNDGSEQFRPTAISSTLLPRISCATLADFTGDGIPDLFYIGWPKPPRPGELDVRPQIIRLLPGTSKGGFADSADAQLCPDITLVGGSVISVGDVDKDNDLDVWIGQYKQPYHQGAMPTPYYDANDGYPAYLLINDGHGRFTDATETWGLAGKRLRRTFSGSLVDLDDDLDLDLVVVSDFAGIDVYRNDGAHRFVDVTTLSVDHPKLFGMGHTFGDFNGDGTIDAYVIGMSSTTARRLDRMKAGRSDFPAHNTMRSAMTFGNRMFLVSDDMTFVQPDYASRLARTGWSWGAAAMDIDNDADLDIYVANGFVSQPTCQDYCTTFWRHDIYTGDSRPNPVIDLVLNQNADRSISWNGYEKNHLFVNFGSNEYVNVAFLLGAALETDCRTVIADDLNLDGKVDVIVSERRGPVEQNRWNYTLLRNRREKVGNWIGIRLYEEPGGCSPVGATVTVKAGRQSQVAKVVTGDSFKCRHANVKHFGLGRQSTVDFIEVRWLNGVVRRISAPPINTYITVQFPAT